MWGAGPTVLLPTASNRVLGSRKWGIGPAVVLVRQAHGWTTSAQLNHVWSFAGGGPDDISTTLVDPWLVRSWDNGVSVKLETESSYDWKASQWIVPLELGASRLVTIAKQPVTLGGDYLYYVERGDSDPMWGMRVPENLTTCFPEILAP
jgi:hypothetical protein